MQIARSARLSKGLEDELAKRLGKKATIETLPPADKQLDNDRKEKNQVPEDKTTEGVMATDEKANREPSKDIPQQLPEKNLEESRAKPRAAAANTSLEGIVEKRLNTAKPLYPHRNEEAYRRTGEKRPINALNEEMDKSGDDDKRARFNEASKAGETQKRVVDEDIGKQLTLEHPKVRAFNLNKVKLAQERDVCKDYLAYKSSQPGVWDKFASVRVIDQKLETLLKQAETEKRFLKDEEAKLVSELKAQKAEMLLKTAAGSGLKLNAPERKAAKVAVANAMKKGFQGNYWKGVSDAIAAIEESLMPLGLDVEKDYILTGRDGHASLGLFKGGQEVNAMVVLTWHKLDNADMWEVVAYVS